MIAEICHKNSNDLEDELTGNFFGSLRYIPFSRGLKKILQYCIQSRDNKVKEIVGLIGNQLLDNCFWKKSEDNRVELDYYIETESVVIGIEAKYNSGLSGEDQLEKEAMMLQMITANKNVILLLVARERDAKQIYLANYNKKTFGQIHLAYMTWEDAFMSLANVETASQEEETLINDLKDLLLEKGLNPFQGFAGIEQVIDEGNFGKDTGKIIHNAYNVLFETLSRVELLIDKCKMDYDENTYILVNNKPIMNNGYYKNWPGWIQWSFLLCYQRCSDGKVMKNGWINGPLYFIEFNLDPDTCLEPELIIAKSDFGNIRSWSAGLKNSEFEIIWDILHKTEGFERIECEDYINVRLSEENAKGEYWGFRNMLIHKSDLITLDSNNFRERIFGTIERLAEIDNAVYDDSLKK